MDPHNSCEIIEEVIPEQEIPEQEMPKPAPRQRKPRKPVSEQTKQKRLEALKKARAVKAQMREQSQKFYETVVDEGYENDYEQPREEYQPNGIRRVGRPRKAVAEDLVDDEGPDAEEYYQQDLAQKQLAVDQYGRPKLVTRAKQDKVSNQELLLQRLSQQMEVMLRDTVKNKRQPRLKQTIVSVPQPAPPPKPVQQVRVVKPNKPAEPKAEPKQASKKDFLDDLF